jgi:hypothetical protein
MPVNVVGIERKEAARIGVDLAAQTILDPLAHHRPLLARDGLHVGLHLGRNLLAKADVEILRRPFRVTLPQIAQLQVLDVEAPRVACASRSKASTAAGVLAATPP